MSKQANAGYLDQQAAVVRDSLEGNQRDELFKTAVEAGYLTALADGAEDAGERDALVKAVEILSAGLVIEWEFEIFLGEAYGRISQEGVEARAVAVGRKLNAIGAAEPGLLIAAIVAHSTGGLDKTEAQMLEKIGTAAGLDKAQIIGIVKKARGSVPA